MTAISKNGRENCILSYLSVKHRASYLKAKEEYKLCKSFIKYCESLTMAGNINIDFEHICLCFMFKILLNSGKYEFRNNNSELVEIIKNAKDKAGVIVNSDKTIKNGFTNLFDIHFEDNLKKLEDLSETLASKQLSIYFSKEVKGKTMDFIENKYIKE